MKEASLSIRSAIFGLKKRERNLEISRIGYSHDVVKNRYIHFQKKRMGSYSCHTINLAEN